MNKTKIKTILEEKYGYDMVNSIMSGRRTPSFKVAKQLLKEYDIPVNVWVDIKSYLQQNSTKTNETIARPQEEENKATA